MTHAIYSREFTNLTIRDFVGAPASSKFPAIELKEGKGLILENNRTLNKNFKLIHQSNISP